MVAPVIDFRLNFLRNIPTTTPCLGENKNARTKIAVAAKAITGPEGILYKKLKYSPVMEDTAPKNAASTTMTDSRFVNRYAVEAGVINKDTTRITPTVCSEATVTNVSKNIIV